MSSPNASSRWPKCTRARASRAGAEGARRDTMPGGGDALATVGAQCSVGKVRLQQGSTVVVPCCSLA